jgi:hypothetical protein
VCCPLRDGRGTQYTKTLEVYRKKGLPYDILMTWLKTTTYDYMLQGDLSHDHMAKDEQAKDFLARD